MRLVLCLFVCVFVSLFVRVSVSPLVCFISFGSLLKMPCVVLCFARVSLVVSVFGGRFCLRGARLLSFAGMFGFVCNSLVWLEFR